MSKTFSWKDLLPEEQAKHPETPPDVLFSVLLQDYTEEVLANPALPLIAVENPELWKKIQWGARFVTTERNFRNALEPLSMKSRAFFAVECTTKSLSHFETLFPTENRVRQALQFSQYPTISTTCLQQLLSWEKVVKDIQKIAEKQSEDVSMFYLPNVQSRFDSGMASKEDLEYAIKLGTKESELDFGFAAEQMAEAAYRAICATSLYIKACLDTSVSNSYDNLEESFGAGFYAAMSLKNFSEANSPRPMSRKESSEIEFSQRERYTARLEELLSLENRRKSSQHKT